MLIAPEQGVILLAERTREIAALACNPTSEVIAGITAQLLGLGANIDEPYVTKLFLDNGKTFEFLPEVYDAQGGLDANQKPIMWVLFGRENLSLNRFFKLNVYSDNTTMIEIITVSYSEDDEEQYYMKPTDLEWSI